MPKQFKGVKERKIKTSNTALESSKKGLATGKFVLILVILLILLAGGAVAAYFLVFKPYAQTPPSQTPTRRQELESQPVPALEGSPTATSTAMMEGETEEELPVVATPTATFAENEEEMLGEDETETVEVVRETLGELIKKVATSYDSEGNKTTEAVLSLERENFVNYRVITISEYIPEVYTEYFAYVAGQPYEVMLRGETPSAKSFISITYTDNLLKNLDIIAADLRIGYLSFEKLAKSIYPPPFPPLAQTNGTSTESVIISDMPPVSGTETKPQIWEIQKAKEIDETLNSISSSMQSAREGIYAIVPYNVNELIALPQAPASASNTGEITEEPSSEPKTISMGDDRDADMLTDTEELIYGTSPFVADSDSDGYGDGEEVVSLFSPARGSGMKLSEDTQFKRFVNTEYQYSALYPASFTASPLMLDSNKEIVFKAVNNEAIFITAHRNDANKKFDEWVLEQEGIVAADKDVFMTKSGNSTLYISESERYYVQLLLDGVSFVYVFSYTSDDVYSYLTTMRMMVESLEGA